VVSPFSPLHEKKHMINVLVGLGPTKIEVRGAW